MKSTTIFLADHHPLFRQSCVSILKLFSEFRVMGNTPSMAKSLTQVKSLRPDIVIIDCNLPDGEITEGISWVKKSCPTTKIIILTESENIDDLLDLIDAGASAYEVKGRSSIKYVIESIKLTSKKKTRALAYAV